MQMISFSITFHNNFSLCRSSLSITTSATNPPSKNYSPSLQIISRIPKTIFNFNRYKSALQINSTSLQFFHLLPLFLDPYLKSRLRMVYKKGTIPKPKPPITKSHQRIKEITFSRATKDGIAIYHTLFVCN